MAQADVVLALLTQRVTAMSERVAVVRRRLADRENLPGVNALLDGLVLAIDETARRRRIETSALSSQDDAKRNATAEAAVKHTNHLESVVGLYLSAVIVTHGSDFDMLIRPLRRLAKLLAPDTEIVFQPADQNVYRVSGQELIASAAGLDKSEDGRLDDALAALPRVVAVEYPAVAEAEVFQHAQIAHEFAHLVLRQPDPNAPTKVRRDVLFDRFFDPVAGHVRQRFKFTTKPSFKRPKDFKSLPESRQRAIDSGIARRRKRHELAKANYEAEKDRLRNWAAEFFCDGLALRLVGPAFFFALYESAARHGPWYVDPRSRQGRKHPHFAWRIAVLGEKAEDYFDASAAISSPEVCELLDQAERERLCTLLDQGLSLVRRLCQSAPPASHDAVERDVIAPAVAELHQQAEEMLQGGEYRQEDFWRELAPVVIKLEAGIPPAERLPHRHPLRGSKAVSWRLRKEGERATKRHEWSHPFDWRSILNGAYIEYLLHEASSDRAETLADARALHGRRTEALAAVRGSIELSELLRQAHELRRDAVMLDPKAHALA